MFQIQSEHEHLQQSNDDHLQQLPESKLEEKILQQVNEYKQIGKQANKKIRKIKIKTTGHQNNNQYAASDALIPQLQESIVQVSEAVFEAISNRRKNLQLSVYSSLVESGKEYLNRLLKNDDDIVHNMIKDIVFQVCDTIYQEIQLGQYNIHKVTKPKKQDIFNPNKSTEQAIRIRQQLLKAKLSDLQSQINISTINMNSSSAGADLQNQHKIRRAKQFVKRMQEHQAEQRRERQKQEQYKRQKALYLEEQKRDMQERVKKQKHQQLINHYSQKRQEKQKQRKNQQEKNAQFNKFLQEFKGKTPLFKQKQQQFFKKVIIPENNRKLQILRQIKQDRKPLSHQDLKQHERQYLQIREDHHYQKNAANAMQDKVRKPEKIYYRSKFHKQIEKQQQMKEEEVDELQIKTQMHKRRWEYGNQIKTKFAPKIDPVKKQQIVKRTEQLDWLGKLRNSQNESIDLGKNHGKDNLQKVHRYVAELKAKGKIRSSSTSRTLEPTTNSARYKNYLAQLRDSSGANSHTKTSRAHSIDYSSMLDEDGQKFKMNFKIKDQNVQRRQQYLQNLSNANIEKYMQQKRKLDEDYLENVKAKMAIINKFK